MSEQELDAKVYDEEALEEEKTSVQAFADEFDDAYEEEEIEENAKLTRKQLRAEKKKQEMVAKGSGSITDAVFSVVKDDTLSGKNANAGTAKIVDTALRAGIIHKVKSDYDVQERILKTADKVITTNLDVAESHAEKSDKEAFFDAHKDAVTYFGYEEKTTSKFHVGIMKSWAWVFNLIYIMTFGIFLIAPIVFFVTKLKVVIKQTWLVVLVAILIYLIIIGTPFLITWLEGV